MTDDQKRTVIAITLKLTQLGHQVNFVEPIGVGPLITTYRFAPRNAAKVAQIAAASQDIALALAVEDVTIRRLPGESVIGVSVPNTTRSIPLWRDNLASDTALDAMKVPLALGVDSSGRCFREDLSILPHLLIAGSTGGGKTVCIRSMIAALMYWRQPKQVQFVVSDTKQVEFGVFDGSAPLWRPRTTSVMETMQYMEDIIGEMERRLAAIAAAQAHNIHEYNDRSLRQLPYIVFVIDELADFVGKAAKGVSKIAEPLLSQIVAKSRAAGVYVIAATQRPSVDVVSGSIKSNFPARLSFRLPSEPDSRTVLGHSGAEHLLSRGDMFYLSPNHAATRRLHSFYATTEDIQQCVALAQSDARPVQKVANLQKPVIH
jgi:DNA segregation ATPase FtsK/SpoIIIE, S-DNA-T family